LGHEVAVDLSSGCNRFPLGYPLISEAHDLTAFHKPNLIQLLLY
jgi:hypothetical protein